MTLMMTWLLPAIVFPQHSFFPNTIAAFLLPLHRSKATNTTPATNPST